MNKIFKNENKMPKKNKTRGMNQSMEKRKKNHPLCTAQ
jgi:hypothetical protein